jgi:hypothetical protein
MLVAVAMALAFAHALRLPGKMRLNKETYLGSTDLLPWLHYRRGIGVGGGMVALLILLVLTPYASTRFWWTLATFLSLVTMHLIYWVVTQPVNRFWTKDIKLTGLGATFFSRFSPSGARGDANWSRLRDVWEYSHVGRAIFAMLSLISLTIAIII